jgi:hypothetical protein
MLCCLANYLLQVFLHPKGHIIESDDVGLVICWDLRSAYAISKFGDRQMQKKKWRNKKWKSSIELQKYRTGPIVDESERTRTAEHMSYTAVTEESLESRMKSEICSRIPEGRENGSDDAIESGEFLGRLTQWHHSFSTFLFHGTTLALFAMKHTF